MDAVDKRAFTSTLSRSCSDCKYYTVGICKVYSDKYQGRVAAVTARVHENMCGGIGINFVRKSQ